MNKKQNNPQSNSANARDKYLQQLSQLEEMMKKDLSISDEDSELEDFTLNLDNRARNEIPAPEPLDQSKYNIDNIVDVLTFVKHPYYLNLTPMPWQELILKLLYMGSPGNTHLKINKVEPENRTSCSGCVWEFIKNDEEKFYQAHKSGKKFNSILKTQNSPCLTCTRINPAIRESRYEDSKNHCKSILDEQKINKILLRDIVDNFNDETDLINNEELDQLVIQQLERKVGHSLFQELVLILGRRSGKQLDLNTPILTTNGWSTMGEVKIGDYVFASDGSPTMVVAKSNVDYSEQAYEMTFSNGDIIVAGENHQWATLTKAERKKASRGKSSKQPQSQIFTTKEISESLTYGKPRYMLKKGSKTERSTKLCTEYNHAIETTKPLIYSQQELPIHPYLLGAFLGDGTKSSYSIAGIDLELFDYIQLYCNHNIKHSDYNQTAHYVQKHNITNKSFVSILKEESLYKNKHIPRKYLESSIEQRMELLRGLNDTDGCVDPKKYTIEFCNTNKRLAYDYYELVCGLGFKAVIKESDAKLYGKIISKKYRITYSAPLNTKLFNLSRKQETLDKHTKSKSDISRIFIKSCIPVQNNGMQCIQVDHPSHMYLAGKSLIPTHNSFITSVIALYELYKLLSMKHPQARHGLLEFDEIYILNVASNQDTAKTAIFSKIKTTVNASPYFQPYIGKDNELELRFLTEYDLEETKRRVERGLSPFMGSIVMKCGTSSAVGLVGKTCWCIIMDEIVAMAGDNPDGGNDFKLYEDLKPSIATFGDEAKFIMLSQPKGPVGLLYDMYVNRMADNTTLILKLPTWIANPKIDVFWLEDEKLKDPKEYSMQYGAEFGASSETPFLPEEIIDRAFSMSKKLTRTEGRSQFFDYFCHVDPARTSDYYALCVAHFEPSGRKNVLGREMKKAVIDYLHFWIPLGKNNPVSPEEIEQHIMRLHSIFKFKQVSFDQWHSQATIVSLQQRGVPAVLRVFNKDYKEKIYGNLFDLFSDELIEFYQISSGFNIDANGNRIDLNEIEEAKTQFYYLQKKWMGTKYKIEALKGYKDDLPDCIAAATYEALNNVISNPSLPKNRLINNYGRMK